MTHEDSRRILTSMPYKDGEIKIIVAKERCELGNHYHKIKTENFTLIAGSGIVELEGEKSLIYEGDTIEVNPNEKHAFFLDKDSILFCICSHPYDHSDDYTY